MLRRFIPKLQRMVRTLQSGKEARSEWREPLLLLDADLLEHPSVKHQPCTPGAVFPGGDETVVCCARGASVDPNTPGHRPCEPGEKFLVLDEAAGLQSPVGGDSTRPHVLVGHGWVRQNSETQMLLDVVHVAVCCKGPGGSK